MSANPSINIDVFSPQDVSKSDRAAFAQMVLNGGEVDPETLARLIDRALALAFARIDGTLVGVGAIKRPYRSHRKAVFEWAKACVEPAHFPFELGWIYVDPAVRNKRLASRIVEALLPSLNGAYVYATSRVNNTRMHASLKRFGFESRGFPYPSKQNEPEIQLFVRA